MTPEDCQQVRGTLGAVTAVEELRLGPSVTEDGWCRLLAGPLGAGFEWRAEGTLTDGTFEVRQTRFEVEDLGTFRLTGEIAIFDGTRIALGPVRLTTRNGDRASLTAEMSGPGPVTLTNMQTLEMGSGTLSVAADGGLIGDILAWAFRLDRAAAGSSFIAARDQREEMLTWLEDEAVPVVDSASAAAFRKMIEAYPRARGTAEITLADGATSPVGQVLSAVVFGTSLTRGEAADLIKEAGLRFTWTPK